MKLFKLFILVNIINFAFCYITASFEADPTQGVAPLEVFFTDYSYSDLEITSWMWDFENDGVIDSEEQNPFWMYIPGVYSVKLKVSNGVEVDSVIIQNMISVSEQSGEGTDIYESSVEGYWSINGSPYRIHNDISVLGERSLYIDQGVLVIFEGDFTIDVFGSIWAEKSAFYRIQGETATSWGGIIIHESGYNENQINNCSIFNTSPGITIKNYGQGNRATTTITNNRVRSGENRQGNYGIEINGDTNSDIQSNTFIGFWDGVVISNTGSNRATSTITNNRIRSGENRDRSGTGLIVDGDIEFNDNDLIGFSIGASITFSDSIGFSRATTTMNNNRVRSGENRVSTPLIGLDISGNTSTFLNNNDIIGYVDGIKVTAARRNRATTTMNNNRVRSGENRIGENGMVINGNVSCDFTDNDIIGYSVGVDILNIGGQRATSTMTNNRVRSGENRFSTGTGISFANGADGYVHDNMISDFDSALVFFGTISNSIHDNLIFVTPPFDASVEPTLGSTAIYLNNSTDTLDVNNNTTFGYDLGFVSPNATVNFHHNIIWNPDPSMIPIECENINASYNNIALPWGDVFPGSENLNIDPMFMNPQDGNFDFQPGSEFAGNGNYGDWGMGSNPWNESALNIFFDADITFGNSPLQVNFSSIALQPEQLPRIRQINYEWDFGDGETSTEANPSHIYYNEGEYTVELFAVFITDSSSVSANFKRDNYIKVVDISNEPEFGNIPSSYDFGYTQLESQAIHTFNFKNVGGQTLTISEVNFNDGTNFTFLGDLPIIVQSGCFEAFDVKFQPSEETQYTDKIELYYNNGAIYDLDLIGEGLDVILYEGFEQGDFGLLSPYFIGDTGTGTSNWSSYSPGADGSNFCVVHGNDITDFGVDDWLVTPMIDLTSFTNPTLTWDNGEGFAGGNSTREIRISTTSSDPNDGTFSLLHNVGTTSGAGWNTESVDLSELDGQSFYLAFHYQGNSGGYWGLDDIIVDGEFVSNTPPVADDIEVNTNEDTSVAIVLSGSDNEDDELIFIVESLPSNGTLTDDAELIYVPDENFNGTDSFTYVANDGEYYSEPATVTITVNWVNDPPIAVDDVYSINQGTILSASVIENDYDIENHELNAVLVDYSTIHGSLEFNIDGTFVYSPNSDFSGVDVFTYKVQDQPTCEEQGFYTDCVGGCFNSFYLSWLGDGYCDDGAYGLDFQCDEWGWDCGDCGDEVIDPNGWCATQIRKTTEDSKRVSNFEQNLKEEDTKEIYAPRDNEEWSEIATVTITVNPVLTTFEKSLSFGWNWFSINVEMDDMSPNSVLLSIGSDGITLKNLTEFATYYEGFGWYGMSTLNPTEGYMLQMSTDAELIYTVPEEGLTREDDNTTNYHWLVNPHEFEHNMTITASIEIDGMKISKNDQLGVFVNDECRGISIPTYFPMTDDYTTNLVVYGSEGDELSFRVYQLESNKEIEILDHLTFEVNGIIGNDIEPVLLRAELIPEAFGLSQNYPNPFNPSTTIDFALPEKETQYVVSLLVYNIQGQLVETLINTQMDSGYHSVVWNADNFASGVYIVKLTVGSYTKTQKVLLMK